MDSERPIQATCPECRGPLSEKVKTDGERKICEYTCLVGHTYSARALLEAHSDTEERVLWSAVVALEEAQALVDAVQGEFKPEIASRLKAQAKLKLEQAEEVRKILERLQPFQTGPIG